MSGKWFGRFGVIISLVAVMALASAASAAVSGTVIRARGNKGIGGATVKIAHHKHKHKKKHKKSGKKASAVRPHAGHHSTARTASVKSSKGGHFTLKKAGGNVTLVAHKRGAGSGRAQVNASGVVTIKLHKHHHGHSGAMASHVRHKHKGGRKGHKKKGQTKTT